MPVCCVPFCRGNSRFDKSNAHFLLATSKYETPEWESDSHDDRHPAEPPIPLMNGNGSGLTVLPVCRGYRNSTLCTFSEIRSGKKWRWERIWERVTRSWRHPKAERKHVGTLGNTTAHTPRTAPTRPHPCPADPYLDRERTVTSRQKCKQSLLCETNF